MQRRTGKHWPECLRARQVLRHSSDGGPGLPGEQAPSPARVAKWLGILLALCVLLAPEIASALPPHPIVTNKRQFRIPFKFNAQQLQQMQARELQLFASTDRGTKWEHVQSLTPEGGRFEFRAKGDGEYWFSVKTLDGRNQLHPPADIYEPGLIVIVDGQPPRLDLTLSELAAGRIQLNWIAEDSQLDASTLRLEYKQPGMDSWQQVSVLPRSVGQTTWQVPNGGTVSVRGSVADFAGNTGLGSSTLEIRQPDPAAPKREFRQPIANSKEQEALPELPGVAKVAPKAPAATELPALPPSAPALSAPEAEKAPEMEAPRIASVPTPPQLASRPSAPMTPAEGDVIPSRINQLPEAQTSSVPTRSLPRITPAPTRLLVSEELHQRPEIVRDRWDREPEASSSQDEARPPAISGNVTRSDDLPVPADVPAAGPTGPSVPVDQFATAPSVEMPAAPYGVPVTPPGLAAPGAGGRDDSGAPARLVGTRTFELGYAIDELGPSGVGNVELFITQDNGAKWWKYGDDTDKTSPAHIEVPGEGVYGFSIRVRSGAGLAFDPPQPGERPDLNVVVDLSPPRIEIMRPEQGHGTAINQLMLRWRVIDPHPGQQTVALYYSGTPNGPWELIAAGQPESGAFPFNVGPAMPANLYLRVAARDGVGNIGHADLGDPVVIDWKRPSARVVDLAPAQAPR